MKLDMMDEAKRRKRQRMGNRAFRGILRISLMALIAAMLLVQGVFAFADEENVSSDIAASERGEEASAIGSIEAIEDSVQLCWFSCSLCEKRHIDADSSCVAVPFSSEFGHDASISFRVSCSDQELRDSLLVDLRDSDFEATVTGDAISLSESAIGDIYEDWMDEESVIVSVNVLLMKEGTASVALVAAGDSSKMASVNVSVTKEDQPAKVIAYDWVLNKKYEGKVGLVEFAADGWKCPLMLNRSADRSISFHQDEIDSFIGSIASSDSSVLEAFRDPESTQWILRGSKSGQATLFATDVLGNTYQSTVTVTDDPNIVSSPKYDVRIEPQTLDLTIGDEPKSINAKVTPVCGNDNPCLFWLKDPQGSADVTLDKNGKVTPVSPGQVCLRYYIKTGGYADCWVTVRPKEIASSTSDSACEGSVTIVKASDHFKDAVEALKESVLSIKGVTSDKMTEIQGKVRDELVKLDNKVHGFFDIDLLTKENKEISWPEGKCYQPLKVSLVMKDYIEENACASSMDLLVYYIDASGKRTAMKTWVEGDRICFETTHFSTYAIVSAPKPVAENVQSPNNNGSSGSLVIGRNPSYGSDGLTYDDSSFQDSYVVGGPQTQQANVVLDGQIEKSVQKVAYTDETIAPTGADAALVRTGDAMQDAVLALAVVGVVLLILSAFGKSAQTKAAASSVSRPSLSDREKRRARATEAATKEKSAR